jgi:energy-converting hydrogenase B subunit D
MTPLQIGLFVLAALSGAAVVLTREPRRQVFALGFNGLVLALLFLVLQAPDVAFSELAVNTAALPLLFVVTLAAVRINQRPRQAEQQ